MSQDSDQSPVPLPTTTRTVRRLKSLLSTSADALAHRLRHKAVEHLRDPEHLANLQRHLVPLANWSMTRIFERDPNARLLFDFVDWHDQRHGRQTTASILLSSSLVNHGRFLTALLEMSTWLDPRTATDAGAFDPDEVQHFKDTAAEHLLELLTDLAAHHHPDSPADTMSVDDHLDYLEEADIPDRFKTLGPMTQGRFLRQAPNRSSAPVKLLKRLLNPANSGDLIPHNPALHDRTLQFLVLSTAFVIQSYLLRHLIEVLPEELSNL